MTLSPILQRSFAMKEHIVYPAVFHKAEEGGYLVEFYDLPCFTEGDNLTEAFNMAGECLLAYISSENEEKLPEPTPLENIKVNDGDYVMLVKPCYFDINDSKQ